MRKINVNNYWIFFRRTRFCRLNISPCIVHLFNFLGFHGERHFDIECSSGVASKVDRYGLLLEFLLAYKVAYLGMRIPTGVT